MSIVEKYAFHRAEQIYERYLTAEERARIQIPTSLADLVDKAAQFSNYRAESPRFMMFSQQAMALEALEKLIEGACEMSPKAGGLIWGSVAFILEMVKEDATRLEKVTEFFLDMAEKVGKISFHLNELPISSVLDICCALYPAIVDFWLKAVKYYKLLKSGGIRDRIGAVAQFNYLDKKYQILASAINDQRSALKRAKAEHRAAEVESDRVQSKLYQQSARHRELKDRLDAPNYKQEYDTAAELRYEGTCEWIAARKQLYIDWRTPASSESIRFLFIHGIPGAGKTVLSSWIINDIRSTQSDATTEQLVLYYYFKDTDPKKRTPESAIRSFLDQLMNRFCGKKAPLLSDLESRLETALAEQAVYRDLWDILSASISAFIQAYESSGRCMVTIVMDALDECQTPSNFISDFLIILREQIRMKILVTGRKSSWDLIKKLFSTPSPPSKSHLRFDAFEITPEDVDKDIQHFVHSTIAGIERLKDADRLREGLSKEIGRAENHGGMFLWADFICKEVKRGDQQQLQKLLCRLPTGLDGIYSHICEGIIQADSASLGVAALRWIFNSPRPLQLSELQEGLKLMQSRLDDDGLDSDLLMEHDWLHKESLPPYSEQDIVDACGNLVIVTAEGLLVPVHLTATHFFCNSSRKSYGTSISEAVCALVEDIRTAGLTLGTLCLEYFLTEDVYTDEYLAPTFTIGLPPPSEKENFLRRHPFFNYAVIYWPTFVLDCLKPIQTPTRASVSLLLNTLASFILNRPAVVWLVHTIHFLNIETTIDILEQLNQVDAVQPDLKILAEWAGKAILILTTYESALAVMPELMWKCWPATNDESILLRTWQNAHEPAANRQGLQSGSYAWMHYNPKTDIFLSIDHDRTCLRGQFLRTRVSMRPGLVVGAPPVSHYRAAAISPSGSLVAVMFEAKKNPYLVHAASPPYFLVCWKLPSFQRFIKGNSQPKLVLSENFTASSSIFDGHIRDGYNSWVSRNRIVPGIISFIGDNFLLTPGGIWDVKKKEWINGPATIYQPMMELGMLHFSGNGQRAARISVNISENSSTVEFFDTREGKSVCKADFPNTVHIFPLAFSHSGKRFVLFTHSTSTPERGVCPSPQSESVWCTSSGRLRCFDLEDQSLTDLDTPYPIHAHSVDALIAEGEKGFQIVAYIEPCREDLHTINSTFVRMLGVWNFGDNKLQCAHLAFKFFSKPQFAFCVVPGFNSYGPEVIIATPSRPLTHRSLYLTWSEEEEEKFQTQYNSDRDRRNEVVGFDFEKKTFSNIELSKAHGSVRVFLKTWSFQPQPPHLISTKSWTIEGLEYDNIWFSNKSSTLNYLVAQRHLFHITPSNFEPVVQQPMPLPIPPHHHIEFDQQPIPLPIPPYHHIESLAFSAADERLVLLHYNTDDLDDVWLTVIDIDIHGDSISLRLTTKFPSEFDIMLSQSRKNPLAFNPVDSSAFNPVSLAFNPVDPSRFILKGIFQKVLAESERMKLVDRTLPVLLYELTESEQLEARWELIQVNDGHSPSDPYPFFIEFSSCGRYVIWDAREAIRTMIFYRIPIRSDTTGSPSLTEANNPIRIPSEPRHPVTLRLNKHYICEPYIFVVVIKGPIVVLLLRIIGSADDIQLRSICVLTDSFGAYARERYLIWPEDGASEVLFVCAHSEHPIVTETGIRSADMMKVDAWCRVKLRASESGGINRSTVGHFIGEVNMFRDGAILY